jgi:hypothetical protein
MERYDVSLGMFRPSAEQSRAWQVQDRSSGFVPQRHYIQPGGYDPFAYSTEEELNMRMQSAATMGITRETTANPFYKVNRSPYMAASGFTPEMAENVIYHSLFSPDPYYRIQTESDTAENANYVSALTESRAHGPATDVLGEYDWRYGRVEKGGPGVYMAPVEKETLGNSGVYSRRAYAMGRYATASHNYLHDSLPRSELYSRWTK